MTRSVAYHRRRGFTLVELLVVIGLILFLMSISVVALTGAIGTARERATQATILKIHGLMQQRIDAFNRAMERTNLAPAISKMKRDWYSTYNMFPPDRAIDVMVRKQMFQSRFPQNYLERNLLTTPITGVTVVSGNHKTVTESASLLYWILTNSEVYGVAPVDESEFSSSEIRDTDGDGLNEFVDGWGRPLRFYRWPMHLFRPGDGSSTPPGVSIVSGSAVLTPVNRTYVGALWSGLPAVPTVPGELDPLTRDPDDPTGQLWRFVNSPMAPAGAITSVQNFFGTPNTYHAFLIVSAGPDGDLGMLEPSNETTVNLTTPSLGTAQGRLAALTSWASIESNPINDNITNRKR